MPTSSHLVSRRDLEFLLYEWLDVEKLSERDRFADHDRSSFDGVLDIAEELATEQFAPINRLLDEHEPTVGADGKVSQPEELKRALDAYTASGLGAATFDEQYGGGQLPYVIHAASSIYLQAGSVGVVAYPFLSQANANPADAARHAGADRELRHPSHRGALVRHHGAQRTARRLVARRHHHARDARPVGR